MIGLLALALTYAGDADILIPGPLSGGHSPVANCSTCHTGIQQGSFGWLHALVSPASLREDTKACLTCHQIAPAALQPHGEALDQLEALTKRSLATPAAQQTPLTGMIRNKAFPASAAFADGVFCATCHKEHQGSQADLSDVSSQRCQACHAVQFDSFESGHPQFSSYPYTRRTRINFDHASHFGEHFGKTRAKNDPAQPVPGACADCHQPAADKMRMGVEPFAKVCSACHLHQIAGTERLSSHQGIAFLALPGLDVETLEERGAAPGAWPRGSEAKLSPFMALLIGRDRDSQSALKMISELNLQNLTDASEDEIAAVNWLAWEIKSLLHALSTEKPSDALKRLTANGADVDADLLGRLTAQLPRDVVTSAIREWLPALEVELAEHQPVTPPKATELQVSADGTSQIWISQTNRILEEGAGVPQPNQVSEIGKTTPEEETEQTDEADVGEDEEDVSDILSDEDVEAAEDEVADEDSSEDSEILTGDEDLDILTGDEDLDDEDDEEEAEPAQEEPVQEATSTLDAQGWAELGGWYRQDFAILYKPTGHADSFFQTWLNHAASLLGDGRISEPVFAALIDERAQGQCTKCHSVDADAVGGRTINWGTATNESMEGKFTVFAHEPHFGFTDNNKGCTTCHDLDQKAPYQKGFEDHNPATFASNFKSLNMERCTTCHRENAAGTTCLTCHEYHVNDVKTPVMSTKVPE